jgi:hypothetical protein
LTFQLKINYRYFNAGGYEGPMMCLVDILGDVLGGHFRRPVLIPRNADKLKSAKAVAPSPAHKEIHVTAEPDARKPTSKALNEEDEEDDKEESGNPDDNEDKGGEAEDNEGGDNEGEDDGSNNESNNKLAEMLSTIQLQNFDDPVGE